MHVGFILSIKDVDSHFRFSAGNLVAFTPDGTEIVYNLGDMSFVICAMALVWIMIPGVGFFYSGLLRRKNALSMMYTSLASIAVVSFQVGFLGPSMSMPVNGLIIFFY